MNSTTYFYYKLVIAFFLSNNALCIAQNKVESVSKTRILFILDASGSMSEKWGDKSRIVVAKQVLSGLIDSLKSIKNLDVALRVYGHQYDKKLNNCKDTKLEVPFKINNHEQIKSRLLKIEPKGTTLISYSLEQVANDFPESNNGRNIVILLTDGIESCGGDPCKLSHSLSKKKIFLKPFIIGMGANLNFAKAFECMGTYFDVGSAKDFQGVLHKIIKQTLSNSYIKINLLDIHNKPTETNVNISLFNTFTEQSEYEFVHYLDASGNTDAIKVDPILSYRIVVNTIPKVIKDNIVINPGNNIIDIKTPQGILLFRNQSKEYKNLNAVIKQHGKPETINIQKMDIKEKYLVGNYDIEILTQPRIKIENLKITQSTIKEIEIPAPGWLNIAEHHSGYGSIYKITDSGNQEWVVNLENESSKTTLLLLPGNYKFIFRSSNSKGSEHTISKKFNIKPGLTTSLKLY